MTKKKQPEKKPNRSSDINLLMYDAAGKLVRVAINPKYRDELLDKFDWTKVPNASDVSSEWFA